MYRESAATRFWLPQSPPTFPPPKKTTATCPIGTKVINGGVRIVSGERQLIIDEAYPSSDTTFYGETRTVGGDSVNYGMLVYVICANVVPHVGGPRCRREVGPIAPE